MAIPASIQAQIAALSTAFNAATPLAGAPRASVKALQVNAGALVAAVDSALLSAAGALDTFAPASDVSATVDELAALLVAAQNQSDLAALRGVVGRIASNLDQA